MKRSGLTVVSVMRTIQVKPPSGFASPTASWTAWLL